MNRRSLRRTSSVLAGLGLAVLGASNASAVPVATQLLANGQDSGPQEEYGGPGNEQSTVDYVVVDGKTYVVSIYMSSKVSETDAPWQCKCSSMVLSADGSPELVADQVQLTDNEGDRPCNHPMAASDGTRVFWTYGADNGNANTRTYVTAVDHMCNTVMDMQKISQDNNNNEGAPTIVSQGPGKLTAGYLSTGENDRSIAVGLNIIDLGGGQVDVEQTYHTTVVTPSNIGRPSIVKQDDGYALFCAAKGNNRPPEDGVECAQLDANTGDIMFKQIIAASQPDEKIYMNQPTIVALDNGYYALHVLESSGEGKTNNKKGSNISHDYILTPGSDGFTINAHEVALGNYPTHSTVCSGMYGVEGKKHFGSFGAAVTGNGAPLVQFFGYENAIKADPSHNTWVAGWYADSGKLANLYGANPNTQGRDFLRCIGDVPNPGYGQPNGFLPSVKTFFVVPHAGRIPGEEKNSQWLSFIPGQTSEAISVDPPADVKDIGLGPQGEGPVDSNPPGPGSEPSDPGAGKDEPSVLTPTGQSGCSASAGSKDFNGMALAVIGLGLAMVSRRRKGA